MPKSVFSYSRATFFTALPRFFISSRNLKKFSLNSSSVGVVRKNQRNPRAVRSGEVESALRKGTLSRSAAWLAVAVTFEL